MPQLLPTHDLAMQQLSYWSEIKQRDEQCRHLVFCLVFKMTKLICMQALVHSANRYRYEPINWNRLSITDTVLAYSPTSFGLCQRTHGTGLSSMQQLAEPLFILHCVFLHCMNEIESVVKDFYPDQYSRNTLRQPFSCCNNLVPSTRFELVTSDF